MRKKTVNKNQQSLFPDEVLSTTRKRKVKEVISEEIKKVVTTKNMKISGEGCFPYPGGKSRKSQKLISYTSHIPHRTFVSLFCGSGKYELEKPRAAINIINDYNSNLMRVFDVIQKAGKDFDEFIFTLFFLPKSLEMFNHLYKVWEKPEWSELTEGVKAAYYFYCLTHSWNADLTIGKINNNLTDIDLSTFAKIYRTRERLFGFKLENNKSHEIVHKYNKKSKSNNDKVYFFADPPYVVADEGRYYEKVFGEADHKILANDMKMVAENNNYFLMTYDDDPLIRELYKDFNIIDEEYVYSIGNNNKTEGEAIRKNELIITNMFVHTQSEIEF